jgi:anti-sigma regulatory factor (Ser/Thr protein kinase)
VDDKPLYEGSFAVIGGNFDHAGEVSSGIKAILKRIGLPSDVIRKASLVAYESEINIVSYARKGMIRLRVVPDSVMIETIDEGPGIPDINLALQPGYSTATDKIREMGFGAGMGLCNIKSFSDIFHISSEIGKGTCLRMIIKTNHGS